MKIWHLGADVNNFDNLIPIKEEDWNLLRFDGIRLSNIWKSIPVRVIEDRKKSDTPGLSAGIPVFSSRSIEVLNDLMADSVEILPLRCRKGDYYAINVLNVLDCIDYESSEFKKFENSGRIMRFIKYSFKPNYVNGKHIFKIVDEPVRRPFVSDEFRNRVLDNELVGFKFDLVWDSELGN